MSARLIGRTGATAGQDFVLMDVATIGAAPDSEIRIVAPGVSRRHARIVADKNQYFLEDAGATNGTFLNGGRVQREELRHLDVITLGRAVDLIFIKRENETPVVVADQITNARVQITDGAEAGTVVEVPKGELTFGRAPSCNVVLASGLISKVHARLQRTANQLVLQDLQSINGTFVNGARVDSVVVLRNGDVINFAGVRSVSVTIEGAAATAAGKSAAVPAAIAEAPAFNQEWKTRFVWAPDELALIEAARAEAMQLAAVRAPGAGAAAEKKPAAAPAKPAAPAPPSPKGDIAAAPVAPKPAPPVAPKSEGAPPAKPAPPAAAKPPEAAKADVPPVAPKPAAPVPPKVEPPAPARVDDVKPQAPVKPAGPAQAAVHAAEAPIKPGTPVPIKPDPAAAAVPPKPPGPPVAAAAPPKPATPPAAAAPPPGLVTPKPPKPAEEEPAPTMAIMAGGDVTSAADNTLPGAARAPRIRGMKLVGPGIPIALGIGTFVVGRAVGSDVRLEDRQVSRSHARITVDEASAMIEDLQTVNGTLVNGKEVKARQALRPGDTVQFGASEFKVELTTT